MIERLGEARECEEALAVSLDAFYPGGAPPKAEVSWRHKWLADPDASPTDVLVIREAGRIVAGLRTVRPTLRRARQCYSLFGIAETFVAPERREEGLAASLTAAAIELGREARCDLLAVIARRAIDRFYLPYGAWGLGGSCEVVFSGLSAAATPPPFTYREATEEDIDDLSEAYRTAYASTFGAMERSSERWLFLLESARLGDRRVLVIEGPDGSSGYAISDPDSVLELGMREGLDGAGLVVSMASKMFQGRDSLVLRIPPQHSLMRQDLGLDVHTRLRECFYGGHVFKILDADAVLARFIEREESWYRRNGVNRHEYEREGLRVVWDGERVGVSGGLANPSYGLTRLLLGAAAQYGAYDDPPLASPYLPLCIAAMDEF